MTKSLALALLEIRTATKANDHILYEPGILLSMSSFEQQSTEGDALE